VREWRSRDRGCGLLYGVGHVEFRGCPEVGAWFLHSCTTVDHIVSCRLVHWGVIHDDHLRVTCTALGRMQRLRVLCIEGTSLHLETGDTLLADVIGQHASLVDVRLVNICWRLHEDADGVWSSRVIDVSTLLSVLAKVCRSTTLQRLWIELDRHVQGRWSRLPLGIKLPKSVQCLRFYTRQRTAIDEDGSSNDEGETPTRPQTRRAVADAKQKQTRHVRMRRTLPAPEEEDDDEADEEEEERDADYDDPAYATHLARFTAGVECADLRQSESTSDRVCFARACRVPLEP
jgi:hypothetical protein